MSGKEYKWQILSFYSLYDHTGMEKHMERMAEQGWLLDKIGSFTWRYRRIEPQKLIFSVRYFAKASGFDPGPSAEQETFFDLCAHTGWALAAASGQMQVFYNEQPDPLPIDTDPVLAVDAIHQAMKKSFLLAQLAMLFAAMLNAAVSLWRLVDDPVETLATPALLFLLVCWPSLLLITGVDIATYYLWRRRALRAAAQGEYLATKSHPLFQKIILGVLLAALVWYAVSLLTGGSKALALAALAGGSVTLLTVALTVLVREFLKRKKVPASTNRAATIAACLIPTLLLLALIPAFIISLGRGGERNALNPREPPLTLADLAEGSADGELDQYQHFTQSPLLSILKVNQYLRLGRDAGDSVPHWLDYTVTEVKLPILYGVCKNDLLHQYDHHDRHYTPVDAAPWGAQEAYQSFYEDTGLMEDYLLFYPDRVVEIGLGCPPTRSQMAVVAEKLGGG